MLTTTILKTQNVKLFSLMKKIFLFVFIGIASCTHHNETSIETNTLLSEYSSALNIKNTDTENYIYRHFCDFHKNDTFCIEVTALREASRIFLVTTDSINLAKDDFNSIVKLYISKMNVIKSIHDKYADTSFSKITKLNISKMDEDKETLLILMRSSLIINKHKAFRVLASQVAICMPIADNEKECVNGKPFVY